MTESALSRMVTRERAAKAARFLFPDDHIASGFDCRAEHDRVGEPCRICAERHETWGKRVAEVQAAMMVAFA